MSSHATAQGDSGRAQMWCNGLVDIQGTKAKHSALSLGMRDGVCDK